VNSLGVIFGLSGPRLTAAESAFFRDADPWAFILFSRNIETPEQVIELTASLRECVGRDCLIFVDQEGGRVQRLGPPHWNVYPAGSEFAAIYQQSPRKACRAAYLNYRLLAADLRDVGITANCAPVLDMPLPGSDPIISDRAYGVDTAQVVDIANAVMAGLMASGVAPVIKHIPGHGRATVDSHMELPVIRTDLKTLEKTDFAPFKALNDAPMAMTAHAVFTAAHAKIPVTIDRGSMHFLVRQSIGFDGLVMSDDLDMKALSGDLTTLTQNALSAGCDIALQCSGKMPAMVKSAKGANLLSGTSLRRARIAEYSAENPKDFDRKAAAAELATLMPPRSALA